jgi:hypothetical protein
MQNQSNDDLQIQSRKWLTAGVVTGWFTGLVLMGGLLYSEGKVDYARFHGELWFGVQAMGAAIVWLSALGAVGQQVLRKAPSPPRIVVALAMIALSGPILFGCVCSLKLRLLFPLAKDGDFGLFLPLATALCAALWLRVAGDSITRWAIKNSLD